MGVFGTLDVSYYVIKGASVSVNLSAEGTRSRHRPGGLTRSLALWVSAPAPRRPALGPDLETRADCAGWSEVAALTSLLSERSRVRGAVLESVCR